MQPCLASTSFSFSRAFVVPPMIPTTLCPLTAVANPLAKRDCTPDSCAAPVVAATRMGVVQPQIIWRDVIASCLAQAKDIFARAFRRDHEWEERQDLVKESQMKVCPSPSKL